MKTQEAADFFGSRVKLAKALGITPSSITGWGDYPPITRQCQIQVISQGELIADAVKRQGGSSSDLAQTIPLECHPEQYVNTPVQASSSEAPA